MHFRSRFSANGLNSDHAYRVIALFLCHIRPIFVKTPISRRAKERELARHALGLPNKSRASYRNHFVAGPGHTEYADSMSMVTQGWAVKRGQDLVCLTPQGARLALDYGEILDRLAIKE